MKWPIYFIVLLTAFTLACNEQPAQETDLPVYDHIVVVFMENHDYATMTDTSAAAFIHQLMDDPQTANFTQSYALGNPSQPNYIMFFSGDNQGVVTNDRPPVSFTTPNLAAQLIDSGYTFISYSEGLPYAGYDGEIYERYVRKHNPVTNWMGPLKNQVDSLLNQPFTSFPTNFDELPTVSFVIPDLDNDMHDGSIAQGDAWLKTWFEYYIEWAKTNNSLFILTFDEGSYGLDGNHIVTTFTGEHIKGGNYHDVINHYNVLRTLQDFYNLPHSGNTKTHYPITEVFE